MANGMISNPSTFQTAIFERFMTTPDNIAINAVAGSGKTSTIVHIANLVAPSDRMFSLFCAFNKAIQTELENRLPKGFRCSTFHALGKSIIEDGLNIRTHRQWVDKWKYWNITETLLGEFDESDKDIQRALLNAINYAQLGLVDLDSDDAWAAMLATYEIEEFHFGKPGDSESTMRKLTRLALERGLAQAKNGDCIDFNDMVWVPAFMPEIRRQKYINVIVDEAQDLNVCQRTLLLSVMEPKEGRMVIVGDPHQAIYGFAGADCDSFPTMVSLLNATEMPLSVSYRCAKSHIELAQSLVPQIEASSFAIEGEIRAVRYDSIKDLVDSKRNDMVISRVTAPIVTLAFELLAAGIPAKIKGRDIMDQICNLAKNAMKGKNDPWDMLGVNLDAYVASETARLQKKKYTEMQIAALQDRAEALDVIWQRSMGAGVKDIDGFKNYVKSVFDETIHGAVTLSTIHKAKGLEADHVFIMNPDGMPHPMAKSVEAQAQELNLKYVAFTRAKNTLYMVAPKPRN
jgi:DNA helicase-2/ATP-dependent DNA helicase PcrA